MATSRSTSSMAFIHTPSKTKDRGTQPLSGGLGVIEESSLFQHPILRLSHPLNGQYAGTLALRMPSERAVRHEKVGLGTVRPLYPLMARSLSRWKRAMDVIGATVGILFLSPIMVIIAIVVKLTSPGPVLFVQERTGHNLRRFRMYKFRTMIEDAAERFEQVKHLNQMTGPLIKIDNDPRSTRIGHFLRMTSMDELPQLFNVLKGDMTFIGPRALSPLPSQYEAWQLRRFTVTPGIACAWQAGRRAERDFTEWMRSDIRYISNCSWLYDLRIFLKTVLEVIRCKGAA